MSDLALQISQWVNALSTTQLAKANPDPEPNTDDQSDWIVNNYQAQKVAPKVGVAKLRAGRDHIYKTVEAAKVGTATPACDHGVRCECSLPFAQMPPGNWDAGRLRHNNHVSASKLQSAIDNAKAWPFTYSKGLYGSSEKECDDCYGKGTLNDEVSCSECDGSGRDEYGTISKQNVERYVQRHLSNGPDCPTCKDKTNEQLLEEDHCPDCLGHGKEIEKCGCVTSYNTAHPDCEKCGGTGVKLPDSYKEDRNIGEYKYCDNCGGAGREEVETNCETCEGLGNVPLDDDDLESAQQHSSEMSKVFQLNLGQHHVDELKSKGLWNTFKGMYEASAGSNHPVNHNWEHGQKANHLDMGYPTLGWVRFTGQFGEHGKPAIHVDELQSDFGQNWEKSLDTQIEDWLKLNAKTWSPEDKVEWANKQRVDFEKRFPKVKREEILKILRGDTHPNELVAEGFMQHLRDLGHHNLQIHWPAPSFKAILSNLDLTTPVPVHFKFSYDELPRKKWAMEPSTYGQVNAQSNPKWHGQPTWKGPVRKAVDPEEFKAITRASDPTGPTTVDHDFHLQTSVPHQALAEVYNRQIADSKKTVHRLKAKSNPEVGFGITRKVLYETPTTDGTQKFMVKPYHERVIRRVKNWMRYPIQGWAEMTNQALYHAGGIGHLHQRVHTVAHNIGNGLEPHLVVALSPGFRQAGVGAVQLDAFTKNPKLALNTQQVALMDFLTNNVDRHSGNILISPGTGALLAVDHSRSFQYKTGSPHSPSKAPEDRIKNYIHAGGLYELFDKAQMVHPDYGKPNNYGSYASGDWATENSENWTDAFDWVGEAAPKLESVMRTHLKAIKDSKIRDHVWRNFKTRLDMLAEMSEFGVGNYGHFDWHKTEIPIYHPDELTDAERRGY